MWLVHRAKEQKCSKGLKFRAGVRGPKYRTMKTVTETGKSGWRPREGVTGLKYAIALTRLEKGF